MGRVYTCVGRYASTPYTIKKTHIHIYCVEELCYYIRENAHFIDEDFFDRDLLNWFEEECNLVNLSKKLKSKLRQNHSVDVLVRVLFEEVHYAGEDVILSVTSVLKNNENLSNYEKLKLRGDFLLKNEKYALALECYLELANCITSGQQKERDKSVLAATYHNLGVVYARLFIFDEAGAYFKKAYETIPKNKYMLDYFATLRFNYTDDVYVNKLNDIEGGYDYSGELEKIIESANSAYENSDDNMRIKALKQIYGEGMKDKTIEKIENVVLQYKDEYRSYMEK